MRRHVLTLLHLHLLLNPAVPAQLVWWKANNSTTALSPWAVCLTGTKRTLHATWPRTQRVMDKLAMSYGNAQPDIFAIMQTNSEGKTHVKTEGRHVVDVYDDMPLEQELHYLLSAAPGLVHADLVVSENNTLAECAFHPVSMHRCCNQSRAAKSDPVWFGPWLSMYRANLCCECFFFSTVHTTLTTTQHILM